MVNSQHRPSEYTSVYRWCRAGDKIKAVVEVRLSTDKGVCLRAEDGEGPRRCNGQDDGRGRGGPWVGDRQGEGRGKKDPELPSGAAAGGLTARECTISCATMAYLFQLLQRRGYGTARRRSAVADPTSEETGPQRREWKKDPGLDLDAGGTSGGGGNMGRLHLLQARATQQQKSSVSTSMCQTDRKYRKLAIALCSERAGISMATRTCFDCGQPTHPSRRIKGMQCIKNGIAIPLASQ